MMLGLNLENTTSEDFRVTFTGRYLAFDVLGSGSELRIDGTLGSDPGLGFAYYRPFGGTPLFVEPYAGIVHRTFNVIQDDAVVASYGQQLSRGGMDIGVNLGRVSDLRLGAYLGRLKANVDVGDPGLPEVNGKEVVTELNWRFDSQDSPVVPSRGSNASANLQYVFDGPDITPPLPERPLERRADAVVGRGQPLLVQGRTRPLVRARWRRHLVRQDIRCRPINSRSAGRSISARTITASSAAITTTC